jgi:hypothetical protein
VSQILSLSHPESAIVLFAAITGCKVRGKLTALHWRDIRGVSGLRDREPWYFQVQNKQAVGAINSVRSSLRGPSTDTGRCNGECNYELDASSILIDWTSQYRKVGGKFAALTVVWIDRRGMITICHDSEIDHPAHVLSHGIV